MRRSFATELLLELRRYRLAPIVAALLTMGLALTLADRLLTIDAFRGAPMLAVLASETDDISWAVWHLTAPRDTGAPALVAVGASAMREAFDAEPQFVRRLRAVGLGHLPYVPLFTSGETLTEGLALLSSLNAPRGSVVVMQLSATSLAIAPGAAVAELQSPRLPFLDYSDVATLLEEQGRATVRPPRLWRARGWLSFYARERLDPALTGCLRQVGRHVSEIGCLRGAFAGLWIGHPSRFVQHAYPDRAERPERKRELAEQLRFQIELERAARPLFGTKVAQRIDALCARRGWRLIWLRLPADPLAASAEGLFDDELHAIVGDQRGSRSSLLDLRTLAVQSDGFYDLHHIRSRGASIVTDSVVAYVASLRRTAS